MDYSQLTQEELRRKYFQAIKERGIRYIDVSRGAGISPSMLSLWGRGLKDLSANMTERLCIWLEGDAEVPRRFAREETPREIALGEDFGSQRPHLFAPPVIPPSWRQFCTPQPRSGLLEDETLCLRQLINLSSEESSDESSSEAGGAPDEVLADLVDAVELFRAPKPDVQVFLPPSVRRMYDPIRSSQVPPPPPVEVERSGFSSCLVEIVKREESIGSQNKTALQQHFRDHFYRVEQATGMKNRITPNVPFSHFRSVFRRLSHPDRMKLWESYRGQHTPEPPVAVVQRREEQFPVPDPRQTSQPPDLGVFHGIYAVEPPPYCVATDPHDLPPVLPSLLPHSSEHPRVPISSPPRRPAPSSSRLMEEEEEEQEDPIEDPGECRVCHRKNKALHRMLQCSSCNETVHQSCYDVQYLPCGCEDDWRCDVCCLSPSDEPETCILCEKVDTMLKGCSKKLMKSLDLRGRRGKRKALPQQAVSDLSLRDVPQSTPSFVHVLCELMFGQVEADTIRFGRPGAIRYPGKERKKEKEQSDGMEVDDVSAPPLEGDAVDVEEPEKAEAAPPCAFVDRNCAVCGDGGKMVIGCCDPGCGLGLHPTCAAETGALTISLCDDGQCRLIVRCGASKSLGT